MRLELEPPKCLPVTEGEEIPLGYGPRRDQVLRLALASSQLSKTNLLCLPSSSFLL